MTLDGDVTPEVPAAKKPATDAPAAAPEAKVATATGGAPAVEGLIPDMGEWQASAKEPIAPAEAEQRNLAGEKESTPAPVAPPKSNDVVTVNATDRTETAKASASDAVTAAETPGDAPAARSEPAPVQEEKRNTGAPATLERPPLFAAAWDLEEEEPVFPKRWRLAAWVAGVVGVVCVALYWGAKLTPWNQYLATFDVIQTEPMEADYSLSEAVQDDAEAHKDRKPYQYISVRNPEWLPERADQVDVGRSDPRRGGRKSATRGSSKGRATAIAPKPEPVDETARAYAMLGGGFSAAELTTAEPADKVGKEKVPQVAVRGAQLQGRLDGEVTSLIGTPVIVTMTTAARLGHHEIPSGAELHGVVSGSTYADARIFAKFDFILFEDGSSLDFAGIARDVKGRPGIPGAKLLDGESAKSVGIAGLGGMIAGAGKVIGGVGGILADGAERAADSASDKAGRIDRDDLLVIAEDATPVAVYVQSVGEAG
jgi:hypothetical protein